MLSQHNKVHDRAPWGGGAASSAAAFHAKVRSELQAALRKLERLEQIAPHVDRPSTWAIGNWGMHAAVRALRGPAFDAYNTVYSAELDHRLISLRESTLLATRAELCSRLRCRTLVCQQCKGQTSPPPIQLRKTDDEEAIEAAWAGLSEAFSEPNRSLILHQRGHYSLIFAMREWVEDCDVKPTQHNPSDAVEDRGEQVHVRGMHDKDGLGDKHEVAQRRRHVRELLTCRKGQRPTLWVDWAEVHASITGWSGYAIIEISAVPVPPEKDVGLC